MRRRDTGRPARCGAPAGRVRSESGGSLARDPTHRRPRALLVDDDPIVLHVLAALLDECGIDSVRVSDGHAGLRMLTEELQGLDLLVTDLIMPGLSGDALVMAVRDLGGERDLPILVASSFIDEARAWALKVAGADAVVDKGSGLAPVVAAARSLLAARGRMEASALVPEGVSVPLFRIGLTRKA